MSLTRFIDDFVNSIYDSIDADRSGSLEFDEAGRARLGVRLNELSEMDGSLARLARRAAPRQSPVILEILEILGSVITNRALV